MYEDSRREIAIVRIRKRLNAGETSFNADDVWLLLNELDALETSRQRDTGRLRTTLNVIAGTDTQDEIQRAIQAAKEAMAAKQTPSNEA
jgi:hypothetical protein